MSCATAATRSGFSSVVSATSYPETPPSPCSAPNRVSRDLGPGERKYGSVCQPGTPADRQMGRDVLVPGDYRPRADLVVAVYRHQVEACAKAGRPAGQRGSPFAALRQWADLFVDFLVTKHGLANALQSDSSGFDALHAYFLDRLVPVCTQLLDAAVSAGEIRPGTHAYELMRGIGNLCIGRGSDPRYDPRRLVELLLQGLQRPRCAGS